jgi:hypothetical protein
MPFAFPPESVFAFVGILTCGEFLAPVAGLAEPADLERLLDNAINCRQSTRNQSEGIAGAAAQAFR